MINVVPRPGSLLTLILPPWSLTIRWTIERPSQAAQNRSQVDNDSGMVSGQSSQSPAGGRTSADSVPESRKERTRAMLDSSPILRGGRPRKAG